MSQATEIYVRFPEAQSNIKLQNSIIEGNLTIDNTTPEHVLVTDGTNNVVSSNISSNVFSFLQGLTGNIQDQLDEKPIVYWNNTGEQITDPVILVGTTTSSTTAVTTVTLDTQVNTSKRAIIPIPVNSNSTDSPCAYINSNTSNTQFRLDCRTYNTQGTPPRVDSNIIYIVIGEREQV
jgi:hypothetical protein